MGPSALIEKVRLWIKSSSIMIKIGLALSSLYIFISLSIPFLNLIFPTAIKHIVFMNLINKPGNLTHPETYDIDGVYNFYLNVEPEIQIGLWHFRSPLIRDELFDGDDDYFHKHLVSTSSNIPIVIYLHGNAFDRSLLHRRELCQRLRDELKYDVITFDYRGFGDSSGEATEIGLIKDARFIYNWLQRLTDGRRRIYLWGHSLGSAVACQLAAQLSNDQSQTLAGLIMEAPFLDIHQALLTHWFSLFFRWQPWYYGMTGRALNRNQLSFQTRDHLSKVNCPLILIHADDDLTVPYIHSKQLLQTAITVRDQHRQKKELLHFRIDMISYHRTGYGHLLIYQAPKLLSALKRVIFEEDL